MTRKPQSTPGSHIRRLVRQQHALLEISRSWRHYEDDVDRALREITETAARALDVGRAGVWFYDRERRSILCADLYEAAAHRHSRGMELAARDAPAYFDAIEAEEVLVSEDARTDPRTRDFAAAYLIPNGIGAMLDAPIRAAGKFVGVLCHEHLGGPRRFHDDEFSAAAYLANLVAAALEFRNRLRSEFEARQSLSLLRAVFEASGAAILVLDRAGTVVEYNHRALELWQLPPRLLQGEAAGRDLMAHMAALTVDPEHFIARTRAVVAHPESESIDVLTLIDGRVLEATSQPQRLDGQAIGRVWSYRDITHHKRIEQELRELSRRDPLTGLDNRRAIVPILDREVRRALRSRQPLCVAIIDIDRFKQVNDTFGHPVGDRVLELLARDLTSRLRVTDHAARWGGEEFLVVLPDTDRAGAVTVLEEVREFVARARDEVPGFTVSVGVAQWQHARSPEDLVADADRKLYEAKQAGRNRTLA